MPHLEAEDRRRGHLRVAKGLTTSLISIVFSLVLDATTASLSLGAHLPASVSAARLKVTLGNGTVSAEIAGVPLRRVMEEIGRLGGIEVRWAGAIGEEPISVAFADLPLREALERVLRTRNFALIGSADPASPNLGRVVILDSGRRPPLAAPVPAGEAGAIDPLQLVDEIVATGEPQAKARMRAIENLAVSAREDPGVRMALTQRANEETDEAAELAAVQAESEAVPSWAAREGSEGDGVTGETPADGAPGEGDFVTATTSTTSSTTPTTTTTLRCSGRDPSGCDDGNACTMDTCDESVGCQHGDMPAVQPNGVSCGIINIQAILNAQPGPDCVRRRGCQCNAERTLRTPLGTITALLDGAVTASKVSQCGKKLKAAKRRAQTYAIRVGQLTSKGCLAPSDRTASLLAQAQELAMRAGTLARSAYCAQR